MLRAMSWHVQVTIDCARPHELADWWAETLRWEVEYQDEAFIRSMIEQGLATDDDTVTHRGALVWRTATAIRPVADGDGPDGPRILFQEVPEPKSVKNRIHLDLRPPSDADLDSLRAEIESRGWWYRRSKPTSSSRYVFVKDPDGYDIEILERKPA